MYWIIALMIGGIIGWLARVLMRTDAQMGILVNMLVGIVGSMLGYWVAGLLGFTAVGGIARFLVAVGGAALLIGLLRALGILR